MSEKITFEPGDYYIGDIGYGLGDSFPKEFLKLNNPYSGLHFLKDETKIWFAKLPNREGSLFDNTGNVWGFDFGCFGCIPYDKINTKGDYITNKVNFNEKFEVSYNDDIISIGNFTFSFTPSEDFLRRTTIKD